MMMMMMVMAAMTAARTSILMCTNLVLGLVLTVSVWVPRACRMMRPHYTSAVMTIKLFNIGDNVPGQMKESYLTFLVTGGKGKCMGEGEGSRKTVEDFFFPI